MTTPATETANSHRPQHIADALAATAAPAPEAGDEDPCLVTFVNPIRRETGDITAIRLRDPEGGELRGLNLQQLMTCDVDSVIALVPRIATPMVTAQEVARLKAIDLGQCGAVIRAFFMTEAEKKILLGR